MIGLPKCSEHRQAIKDMHDSYKKIGEMKKSIIPTSMKVDDLITNLSEERRSLMGEIEGRKNLTIQLKVQYRDYGHAYFLNSLKNKQQIIDQALGNKVRLDPNETLSNIEMERNRMATSLEKTMQRIYTKVCCFRSDIPDEEFVNLLKEVESYVKTKKQLDLCRTRDAAHRSATVTSTVASPSLVLFRPISFATSSTSSSSSSSSSPIRSSPVSASTSLSSSFGSFASSTISTSPPLTSGLGDRTLDSPSPIGFSSLSPSSMMSLSRDSTPSPTSSSPDSSPVSANSSSPSNYEYGPNRNRKRRFKVVLRRDIVT